MPDLKKIRDLIDAFLLGSDYVLETLEMDEDANIIVEVDRIAGVDMAFCEKLNRYLAESINKISPNFNFSLEVGSVSLSQPFKSLIQYRKHIGDNVKVTDKENKVYSGKLSNVNDENFAIEAGEHIVFRYEDIKKTEYTF